MPMRNHKNVDRTNSLYFLVFIELKETLYTC